VADVKWIKITTDMFDNRKIRHLRRLPEGNNIVLIWVMLLTMAGRCNAGGMIFLTENIPYNTKMLADELDFEENTVRLALEALERFGMVNTSGDWLAITGWEEHQNVDRLAEIREYNRLAKKKSREKQKLLQSVNDMSMTSQPCHDIDKDIDKDIDIDLDNNTISDSDESAAPSSKPKKPKKHKYGEYNNVLLTEEELDKLKAEYADWKDRIDRLSAYVASTGKAYKSHYATIRNWARKDTATPAKDALSGRGAVRNTAHEQDAYERMKRYQEQLKKTAGSDPDLKARADALKRMVGGR
jgi:predicted phage replisome organizer